MVKCCKGCLTLDAQLLNEGKERERERERERESYSSDGVWLCFSYLCILLLGRYSRARVCLCVNGDD